MLRVSDFDNNELENQDISQLFVKLLNWIPGRRLLQHPQSAAVELGQAVRTAPVLALRVLVQAVQEFLGQVVIVVYEPFIYDVCTKGNDGVSCEVDTVLGAAERSFLRFGEFCSCCCLLLLSALPAAFTQPKVQLLA